MPTPPFAPIFKYADSAQLDAFGRLRVSTTTTLLDSQQVHSSHPLIWDHHTASGGTVVYDVNTSSSELSTNAATSGARALRQTKVYIQYRPGRSQLIKSTFVLRTGAAHSGTSCACVGLYDDEDGIFLREDASGLALVKRTSTSGTPVETVVPQASWNKDPLNGTGISRLTFDPTKTQILVLDFQWLGVGRVRVGFQIDGQYYAAHEFLHANVETEVYIRTASLPVRYEVFNNGGAGADVSMMAICASVEVEGGHDGVTGYSISASNGNTGVVVADGTLTPVLSLRTVDLMNGRKYRGLATPQFFSLYSTGAIHWRLLWNGTLTAPSWTNIDVVNSGMQQDAAASAITGGFNMASGYWGGGGYSFPSTRADHPHYPVTMARTYDDVRDVFTLAAAGIGGTPTVYASLNFVEQY